MAEMDLAYWNFKFNPFDDETKPDLLFLSQSHREAMNGLRSAVADARTGIYLHGPAGSGKSFLCTALKVWLERRGHLVATVDEETDTNESFLMPLFAALRFNLGAMARDELFPVLKAFLTRERRDRGMQTVLIIDRSSFPGDPEARNRLGELLSVQRNGLPLLTVVFTGRAETEAGELPAANGFSKFVSMEQILAPMSENETRQYVEHRLRSAGCWDKIFDGDACDVLHRLTSGLPGHINTLCRSALAQASEQSLQRVSADMIVDLQAKREPEELADIVVESRTASSDVSAKHGELSSTEHSKKLTPNVPSETSASVAFSGNSAKSVSQANISDTLRLRLRHAVERTILRIPHSRLPVPRTPRTPIDHQLPQEKNPTKLSKTAEVTKSIAPQDENSVQLRSNVDSNIEDNENALLAHFRRTSRNN